VTYLGYPDTTGLAAMDCRMVDAITDPVGEADRLASERLARFAPTAWTYDPPPTAPEPAMAREGPIAFGSFNNFSKVNDATLGHWARILACVDGSRLVLKGHGLGTTVLATDVRRRLASAGISEERVDLIERTETIEQHLAAYARIDIALDTFPYHGTTTTCEALWMGVPVVTLAGDRHASRVGASLLTAVGHPEWIASDWSDYVQKAAALAAACRGRHGERGADVERGLALRAAMRRSALLDHKGQSERFGRALCALWIERRAMPAVAA
jgi:predicted O-linked N-acetylglucosamine transferase (SPINDLY family)